MAGHCRKGGLEEWFDKPMHGNGGNFAAGVRECQIIIFCINSCSFEGGENISHQEMMLGPSNKMLQKMGCHFGVQMNGAFRTADLSQELSDLVDSAEASIERLKDSHDGDVH